MGLERVSIREFRNIASVDLELAPTLNLFCGLNGSGKTSLLEAIHVLACARSFQRVPLNRLIRRGAKEFVVRGDIDTGAYHRLGISRRKGQSRVRHNGFDVTTLSNVAWLLPVQAINTRSQELLTGGPSGRRAFLNWSVFHVEQGYSEAWRRYERVLTQRNLALRQQQWRVVTALDPTFVDAATRVHASRNDYFARLYTAWRARMVEWLPGVEVDCEYYRGWPNAEPLSRALVRHTNQEKRLGYSLVGAHRADLRFGADGGSAAQRLSRGQQKLLVLALRFAVVDVLLASGRHRPTLMIDDLPAELDEDNRSLVIDSAVSQGCQLLVTAIDAKQVPSGNAPLSLFHVEQGRCRPSDTIRPATGREL